MHVIVDSNDPTTQALGKALCNRLLSDLDGAQAIGVLVIAFVEMLVAAIRDGEENGDLNKQAAHALVTDVWRHVNARTLDPPVYHSTKH